MRELVILSVIALGMQMAVTYSGDGLLAVSALMILVFLIGVFWRSDA